ncbi:MAG: hypothetical protein BroJett011_06000 [Chloroflexota bacterium]|nr:MAG: hypothetical protein BroJett011_06000 [Chloroflexota bacterium]
MRLKFKPHRPALLLIPAVLSLFWPALLNPFLILFPTFSPFSDVMVIHWPKAHLMAQSWQEGAGLPYWTPLILSGMPLAANQLAMLAYPPAWFFLFLPLEPVFNGLFVFHFLWGGLGIYLLLRERFKLSPTAALLGGLTFALNGKWLAHAAGGHVSLVGAIAWMPWAVVGVHMLLEGRRRGGAGQKGRGAGAQGQNFRTLVDALLPGLGWAVLVGVSLAMQIVTHTLPVIYSVYLIAAMVIWHIASQPVSRTTGQDLISSLPLRITHYASRFLREIATWLVWLLLIFLLAGLLGAAQVLPLLELAQFSNRSLSLSEATAFALSPVQLLVGLLLPSAKAGHEYIIYAGLMPLLLAPFGLTRKNRWTWFYGLLFLFAVLFALGPNNPLHSLFYYLMPGFRWVRTPARIFFVGAFALAVLVGFGADRLTQQQWSPSAKKWLTRLTVALASLALLVGLGLAFGFGQTGPVFRSALALAIFIPLGLMLILLRAQRYLAPPLTLTLLSLLLFFDLAWFDASMLRFVPLDEALSPGRGPAEYLAQKPGYFRVYSPSYSLPLQTAAAADLSLADGVEPVHLAVYDQFMARAGGYHDAGFSVTIPKFGPGPLETSLKDVKPDLKLLGLLNVTYLVSAFPMDGPGLILETKVDQNFIYRNELALPRAWVAHGAVPADEDWLGQLTAQPDLRNVVIVESMINSQQSVSSTLTGTDSQLTTAKITSYSSDRIEVETDITTAGWLVLSEIWYPGWQAMVNGVAQPVEKVNGLLRGLYLSQPGAYHIILNYEPRSVVWGQRISGLTAALLVVGLILAFRQAGRFK